MKINDSRAAVRRYVIRRSSEGEPIPAVPEKCGPVHAILLDNPRNWQQRKRVLSKRLRAVEYIERSWAPAQTVCGIDVRVIYPMPFDTDEDDSCRDCENLLVVRSMDVDVYMRQRSEMLRARSREQPQPKRAQEQSQVFELLDQFYDEPANHSKPGVKPGDPWVFPDIHRQTSDRRLEQGESA
ncbi:hypothetical protein I3U51_23025 [Mycobacteroides abscessus subsp. abscessus]|uniref:hypothetical protein n=1 Tax=Mycobacteroides abscessus TaxID=36809 RepID=UPI0019CFACB6|nr:hypothetical protein [Mycobacteroides abscessus]MBN7443412.1 hypothetical protein [Mycobacteroides abscessus subsp. abscessus]